MSPGDSGVISWGMSITTVESGQNRDHRHSNPEGAIVAKDRVERDDEDLVRLYLTDIGQSTLLTKDDEVRLAKAIESGKEAIESLDAGGKELTPARKRELRRMARQGEEAERQFVQSNLRLGGPIPQRDQG